MPKFKSTSLIHLCEKINRHDVLFFYIFFVTGQFPLLRSSLCVPLRRREGILLCTCRLTLSVCPSVGSYETFSFPINNSRSPNLLKLGPHMRPGQQMNPIAVEVTRSKGQPHRGQMC